ncbi:DUF3997 domain-containing protein [Bacillus sp. FJAT-49711]|uniref:DUF3997 domain-containing protein n=1 Tax=Bacillus sp. FJAT-49711 TaxID=2833585 RepID=UPI001BC94936|nr:DUF3997 domain-containing protein [Bacillus sp. FJAT-49711]MBS4220091.1 DUF3997 domain-containing protein [Bacillus sp. FJAT-49711]
MFKTQKFYYLLLLVVPSLILTGCEGLADYSVDLPGGYSVIRTSAHQVTIAPKESETSWGRDIIPTKVTELVWDDNYILAKQLGLKEDSDSKNGYQIPNKDDIHFWILNFNTGEVFGSLDEKDFREKKVELDISEDVVLKKVGDIK